MQRKLIVALVAGALELYAASVSAQSFTCTSPFTTGPLNPVNGYAETVTDNNGLTLQICKDPALCFFDPVVAGNLTSEQTGTGGESFWWLADAQLAPASGLDAVLVMAAEATYNTEDPTPGEQLSFTRLRLRIDAPFTGVYTVEYPYGRESYRVDTLAAGDEVREVFDISFTPNMGSNTPATGRVGPWLRWTGSDAPEGYIGDGTTPHAVTGSPCDQNFFRITAVDLDGNALPIGGVDGQGQPINVVQTDLFTVMGQISDTRVQTPLASDRVSYARTANGTQIDAFAVSGAATDVEMRDFTPTVGTGTAVLSSAVALQKEVTPGNTFSKSQALASAPASLPAAMELHGSVTSGASDATRLVRALTDSVVISKADYSPTTGKLVVQATSSDKVGNPALTVDAFGVATGTEIDVGGVPPATVTVISAAGGKDTVKVRVFDNALLTAPTAVAATLGNGSVSLTWTDSDTEDGYQVLRFVNAAAVGALVGTPGQNVTGFADVLPAGSDDSKLRYKVASVRGAQTAESNFSNEVIVPINPAVNVTVTPQAANPSTTLVVRWEASPKAVRYDIFRDGNPTRIGTRLPTQTLSFADAGLAADTEHTYRVEAVGVNSSTSVEVVGKTRAALSILAPTGLTLTPAAANAVALAWTDASSGESAYRVTRTRYTADNGALVTGASNNNALAADAQSHATGNAAGLANPGIFRFAVMAMNGATAGPAAQTGFHYNGTVPVPTTVRSINTAAVPANMARIQWANPTGAANAGISGFEAEYCLVPSPRLFCTANDAWAGRTPVLRPATGATPPVNFTLPAGRYSLRVRSVTPGDVGAASVWVQAPTTRVIN